MTVGPPAIQTTLAAINTAGVVGVLVIGLWLGLRGDVVTARQLTDCQMARDTYLHEWIKAISNQTAGETDYPDGYIGPGGYVRLWRGQ